MKTKVIDFVLRIELEVNDGAEAPSLEFLKLGSQSAVLRWLETADDSELAGVTCVDAKVSGP